MYFKEGKYMELERVMSHPSTNHCGAFFDLVLCSNVACSLYTIPKTRLKLVTDISSSP